MVVGFELKRSFFDRRAVTDRLGKAKVRNLSKAGAFVRTSARSSLRRRKKISEPGSPPSVHSTDSVATLKNILFGSDGSDSVIVGPVGLGRAALFGGTTVPEVHEKGGTLMIAEWYAGKGKWLTGSRPRWAKRLNLPTRKRAAKYPPRPFMGPALAKNLSKFHELWGNSIKSRAA